MSRILATLQSWLPLTTNTCNLSASRLPSSRKSQRSIPEIHRLLKNCRRLLLIVKRKLDKPRNFPGRRTLSHRHRLLAAVKKEFPAAKAVKKIWPFLCSALLARFGRLPRRRLPDRRRQLPVVKKKQLPAVRKKQLPAVRNTLGRLRECRCAGVEDSLELEVRARFR